MQLDRLIKSYPPPMKKKAKPKKDACYHKVKRKVGIGRKTKKA